MGDTANPEHIRPPGGNSPSRELPHGCFGRGSSLRSLGARTLNPC